MKRALIVLVAALALMVVPLGAAETTYTDPAGDAGSAPDITAVSVSNEDMDGSPFSPITMRLTAAMTPGSRAGIFMDADLNPSTGLDGIDRILVLQVVASDFFLPISFTWNGSDFVQSSPTMVSKMELTPSALTVAFPKGVIDKGFSFFVLTLAAGDDPPPGDEAPDTGLWTYVLTKPAPPPPPPPVKPMIGKPVGMVAPIAGKKFTVSFPVTSSVDGQPLTTGTAECKTTVAGKTVPHAHTFKGGTVKAVVSIPKAAKGKQLKIAVKVTADTAATKVFNFKVK